MKVQSLLFFAILTSLLAFGCNNKTSRPEENSVSFDTVSVDTVCRLNPDQQQPVCHLHICLARPVEAHGEVNIPAIEAFIVNMVKQGAFASAADLRLEKLIPLYTDNYIEQYRKEGNDLLANYTEQPQEAYKWLSFEERVEGKPLFNQFDFLSYQIVTGTYTGGAHEETMTKVSVLDLKTLFPLTLLDLFDLDVLPMVNEIIQQQLVKDYGCKTIEELGNYFLDPATIVATENFFIDQRGIIWMYDPYEIAPFAMGTIRVSVPWTDVRSLLLPDSPVIRIADFGKPQNQD